jgi:hypothetical protein
MAPEQWDGGPATPATDIYAATAVFFECLTGKTPFSGPLGQLAALHAAADVPVGLVDEPLRPLVARGMAKSPAARPASASQFMAELEVTAAAAYGAGWEDRGRSHLAGRAAALLSVLLSHGGAATGTGTGTTTASSRLPTAARTAVRTGRAGSRALLYTGIAAAVIGVAAGSIAAVRLSSGHAGGSQTAHSSAATPASAAWSKLRWTAAEAPMPAGMPGSGGFEGVACPAPGTCLMAGAYSDSSSNYSNYGVLADTASGGKWAPATYAPIDMGGGSADQPVHGMACAAAGNCMTVGEWLDPTSGYYTGLVDTLSDGTWTPAQLSLPANAGQDQEMELHAVACPAVGNCVVVGSNSPGSGNNGWGLIQTLTGGTWTATEAPLPADAAAGDKAGGNLYGVTCTAPGACVAVGFYTQTDGTSQGLIETLRNGAWTPTTAPPVPGEFGQVWLTAVSCATTTSCVAVGYIYGREGLIETLVNGTWHSSVAPAPEGTATPFPEYLSSVACPAVGACVAVGSDGYSPKSQGVIDTLANGTWTEATAPLPANASATSPSVGLSGVACPTIGYCVASGGYTDDTNHGQGLIESTTQ